MFTKVRKPQDDPDFNFIAGHPRGFLQFYPEDVVKVVNGHPITKADILNDKHFWQARELANKRRSDANTIKPCFIWSFFVGTKKLES